MHVTFDHVEDVAANIKTFWFKPKQPVRYVAGQFIEFYLPHGNPDDRGVRRWFTLSSSPTEQLLSITTKFTPQKGSTFKHALAALPAGTQVQFAEPMGDFVLPKDTAIPLIFIAAGMGVTPMRSMIKWLADTGEKRDVQLLYAVREADELAFKELFEGYLGPSFQTIVGRHLVTDDILGLAKAKPECLIYLAGPEPMVETFNDELQAAGIQKHRIATDFFPGYLPI